MKIEEYCHLMRRAGFGVDINSLSQAKESKQKIIDHLFVNHNKSIPLNITYPKLSNQEIRNLNEQEKRKYQKLNREKIIEYNLAWYERMATSPNFLRERMVFFWSNLFVVSSKNIRFTESFNNVLRTNALGHLKDLVTAISKEASMLNYLDNNKNKKQKPNENFARELMELFTLGRDVLYTEGDIKEAARAFTGWRFTPEGEFIEAQRQHDYGSKKFLGQKGDFNGDDIIRIILEKKECARYICSRVFKHFVSDTPNQKHINELTEVFYTDYDIEKLMRHLFQSKWFYHDEYMASKIKSPIELLCGMQYIVPFSMDKPKRLLALQRIMGQTLLQPPNVAGWPGGRSWIDSNTLMFRLRLPSLLFNGGSIDSELPMEENQMTKKRKRDYLKANIDWESLNQRLDSLSKKELHIITIGKTPDATALQMLNSNNKQNYLLKLMSLPEYQMC
ncbi:DUF1800 domain-containing protein [Carboxylicivirga marina]|uniref:DUF1800 domain-containing protein n=1 Tax=Carboxylicivirga marina TaxID=2800988 RepID=A0ABS1HIJ9_9BACT|nr:DUF1800 domain-containing protein [Carboxylicivirga marina]MBK3517445.1 DUF1800 domain-containing protein [Carboxylicivirga marina]